MGLFVVGRLPFRTRGPNIQPVKEMLSRKKSHWKIVPPNKTLKGKCRVEKNIIGNLSPEKNFKRKMSSRKKSHWKIVPTEKTLKGKCRVEQQSHWKIVPSKQTLKGKCRVDKNIFGKLPPEK